MLSCLFHADDFGLTEGCSLGILEAVHAKRLQATSVMPTGEDKAHNQALRLCPDILINTHLNLLEGKALTEGGERFAITTEDGFFHWTLGTLLKNLLLNPQKEKLKQWIFAEFCAQIDATYTAFPNHAIRLDGHLHIHILPPLRPVIEAIFEKYPVTYVRTPIELGYSWHGRMSDKLKGGLRRNLLSYWGHGLKPLLKAKGIGTADYFLGATASCAMTLEHLEKGLERIKKSAQNADSIVEIMMHPVVPFGSSSFFKDSQYQKAHLTPERQHELAMLLDDRLPDILTRNDMGFFI